MNFNDKFHEFFKTADTTDEWVYSNFLEYLLKDLDSAGAFRMIPEVVEFLLNQSDRKLSFELLEIIISLAHESNTTEIPISLMEKMPELEKLFVENDYEKSRIGELKRIYRLGQ